MDPRNTFHPPSMEIPKTCAALYMFLALPLKFLKGHTKTMWSGTQVFGTSFTLLEFLKILPPETCVALHTFFKGSSKFYLGK